VDVALDEGNLVDVSLYETNKLENVPLNEPTKLIDIPLDDVPLEK
jgi:hypothetical protein